MEANESVQDGAGLVEREQRVTTLELFFDLVFVFTLTQLTALLTEDLSVESAVRVVLIFIVVAILALMLAIEGRERVAAPAAE